MNDKEFIKSEYLPKIKGKILYVGVMQNYDLHPYTKTPESFETIDMDPNVKKGMSPYKHHVGDFLDFKNEYKYDHISMHGLWGNGFIFKNTKHDRETSSKKLTKIIIDSINKAHNILNIGGTLQIGPNTNKVNDIYDYMINQKLYKNIYRISRGEWKSNDNHKSFDNECGNCIFWGEKISNNMFGYKNVDLWGKSIETIGLL